MGFSTTANTTKKKTSGIFSRRGGKNKKERLRCPNSNDSSAFLFRRAYTL
jgi:hypothetical protein